MPSALLRCRMPWGELEVYDRLSGIDAAVWSDLFPESWKDLSYYKAIEEAFLDAANQQSVAATSFQPRYLVLRDFGGTARVVQPAFFVDQDLAISLPGFIRKSIGAVRRLFPRFLYQRILMAGCMVSDGNLGTLLSADNLEEWFPRLDESLQILATENRASIVILKDLPANYRQLLPKSAESIYTRIPSWPATEVSLQGFQSFDDFLQAHVAKATRKSWRRKFRESDQNSGDAPITFEVKSSLTEEESDGVYRLYRKVALRSELQFEVYSSTYFKILGDAIPDRTRFFLWHRGGKLIAFTFCIVNDGTMYDNDIGMDYDVAHDLNLYAITFRDILEWAIENKLNRYYSTPGGYHPKLMLRMDLVPLDLYVRHVKQWMQPVFGRFTRWLEPTRQESVLREFSNYSVIWGKEAK